MKAGIIRCQQTEDLCPGNTDFKVAAEGVKAFEEIGSVEVMGFVSCGGCPGNQFGPALSLEIHLNNSEAARGYAIRGSTTVLVNGQWVPLEIATSRSSMTAYLAELAG